MKLQQFESSQQGFWVGKKKQKKKMPTAPRFVFYLPRRILWNVLQCLVMEIRPTEKKKKSLFNKWQVTIFWFYECDRFCVCFAPCLFIEWLCLSKPLLFICVTFLNLAWRMAWQLLRLWTIKEMWHIAWDTVFQSVRRVARPASSWEPWADVLFCVLYMFAWFGTGGGIRMCQIYCHVTGCGVKTGTIDRFR